VRLSLTEFAKGLNDAPEKLWRARASSVCVCARVQWIDFKEAPSADLGAKGVCLFVCSKAKMSPETQLECC
jgi:hypothetical protein